MIERDFDISFISDLALREKQIQQNYRPVIAVHKWFARRPGTLFRGLLLSEFTPVPLKESFYRSHNLRSIHIADPFMGGGTPLLEANRIGCNIVGYDINPMSYWVVREEIEHLDIDTYETEATKLRKFLVEKIGHLYHTQCLKCGSEEALVKYFLWVKIQNCGKCGEEISLFPGYLISINRRHPNNVFICPTCGDINEVKDRKNPGSCTNCGSVLQLEGPAKRNSCKCPYCGGINFYPLKKEGPPRHRMFAIEYHCKHCKTNHKGRFFKKPDQEDINRFQEAESEWKNLKTCFVPDDTIPEGEETNRLHRWGYGRYYEMFNPRQLLGLELSCQFITQQTNDRVRKALATNLSDLLRYQNMLCHYDTMALKSLDIFSIHGFPVSLVQCESNLLGIPNKEKGLNIGSGGWSNIIDKFIKAKAYCNELFEISHRGLKKQTVSIKGEWIGKVKNGSSIGEKRAVELFCMNAGMTDLPPSSLDGAFTDPPYFGNVQYAELMDFCYVWLRKLTDSNISAFKFASTRNFDELTANETMGRDMEHFTEGLSLVFQKSAIRLKALIESACLILAEGAPSVNKDIIHRLNKADTKSGVPDLQKTSEMDVPYAMLLYERFLGRPFAGHRDSVSELVGNILESAIEDVLVKAGISYRKTKRAERIEGFDQTPDFIIPSEFNPQIIIEAKLTEDDGTARDKVTRIQHLGELSMAGQPPDRPKFEVIACISGRGFSVRREDMKKMLLDTRGKVFTLKTLGRIVECTRLKEFQTKKP